MILLYHSLYARHAGMRLSSLSGSVLLRGCLSGSVRAFSSANGPVQQQQQQRKRHRRRLDVAVVGYPNAGKSQLLNVLTQSTVSAVSRKRHTTRKGVLGARTVLPGDSNDDKHPTQIVFCDTPGFLKVDQAKREGLSRELVVTASSEIVRMDFTLLVVDAARNLTAAYKETIVQLMMYALASQGRDELEDSDDEEENDFDSDGEEEEENDMIRPKFAIVLNKVDLVKPKALLLEKAMELSTLAEQSIKYANQENPDEETIQEMDRKLLEKLMPPVFYTNALHNEGVDDVLQFLLEQATRSREWPLEAGQSTPLTAEERIEEIIREKIYRCLHREVPYNVRQANKLLRVATDSRGRQIVVIHQEILVQTKSHKELVMGGSGRTLERIRETAVVALERMFKCPVNLHLTVKHVTSRSFDWSI